MKRNTETTLITGASSGIGLHLAKEFARHGHPLVLIAPVEEELNRIARDLSAAYHVDVGIMACDLREPNAAERIFSGLAGRDIEILVNNAGHGQKGQAWKKTSPCCSSMSKRCCV